MRTTLLAALLLAAPALALAQVTSTGPNNSTTQGLTPQTNLQDQQNRARQPLNAHTVQTGPSAAQAPSIPTPTFGNPMTNIHPNRTVPNSDPAR